MNTCNVPRMKNERNIYEYNKRVECEEDIYI